MHTAIKLDPIPNWDLDHVDNQRADKRLQLWRQQLDLIAR